MSTLFLEGFGQLSPETYLIDSEEEDLYSVFLAHATLMGWCDTSTRRGPLLWGMEEAELTAGTDATRIGFVQVGLKPGIVGVLEPGSDPSAPRPSPAGRGGWTGYARLPTPRSADAVDRAIVLPPLIQCFDDALRRFGVIELSGLQVTASSLEPSTRSCIGDLVSGLNWFNTTPKARTDALIAVDNELLGGHTEAELFARLQRRNNGSFEFGPVVAVPEQYSIKAGAEYPILSISPAHSGLGLSVTLPEWTASAVGWVLATVIDAARTIAPDVRNFAVRITRVR